MEAKDICLLIFASAGVLAALFTTIFTLVRSDIKKFVIEKMKEAEDIYKDLPKPDKSIKKLEYVIKEVDKKYGFSKVFINVRNYIEKVIEVANSLQNKGLK